MQPELSIIIACRNAEETLGVQLRALSTQVCDVPWEVIVCDNGSTDGTAALARSYADRFSSLRVIDASAQPGPGFARNAGARASQAALLAFCDADDLVAAGWVAAMADGLRRHRFIAGRFESQVLNDPSVLRSRPLQAGGRSAALAVRPGLPHAGAGNLGVHRSVFLSVDGFDPAVGCLEDTDLCWRIQLAGVPLVFWPSAVLHVRLRSSLRGMWRQGHDYGAAAALLEHRFPAEPTPPGNGRAGTGRLERPPHRAPHDGCGPDGRRPGHAGGTARTALRTLGRITRPLRAIVRLVSEQRSVGGVLWSLGWHVGHRFWQAPAGPAVVTPAGGRLAATGTGTDTGHRQAG